MGFTRRNGVIMGRITVSIITECICMHFTDCVACTSHTLLPIGSLLRSRNELFNPGEASITRMFCCHCDNGEGLSLPRARGSGGEGEALGRLGRVEILYTKKRGHERD